MARSYSRATPALILASVLLAPAARAAHDDVASPVVAATFAPDGRLWRVVPRAHSLQVDYSTDLGASFSEPVLIQPPRQRLHIDAEGPPQIPVDAGGTLYVAWNADARESMQTFVVVSTDGGRTFSAARSPETSGRSGAAELRPLLLANPAGAELYFLQPGTTGQPQSLLYRLAIAPGPLTATRATRTRHGHL